MDSSLVLSADINGMEGTKQNAWESEELWGMKGYKNGRQRERGAGISER